MSIKPYQPDEPLNIHQGCVLEEFKEVEEIKGIIRTLADIIEDEIAVELATERFLYVMDQYQEQPHLLDPHLESLLGQLLDVVKNPKATDSVIHLAFKLLYLITKTRGHKVIVRLMPHEVADLEPVLALLDKQNPMDFQTWETRYILLLWLSIVSMIPFDMCRLDSHARSQGDQGMKPTMDRIIDAGKKYLTVSDKSLDAAAYMLSRFMTRPDVKKEKLPAYLDWSLVSLKKTDCQSMEGMSMLSGLLSPLALLFKHGKREDLVSYAPILLQQVLDLHLPDSTNTLLRKMGIKLIQRLGLTFLKARVATWRYQRGDRSLSANLSLAKPSEEQLGAHSLEEEEGYDIPEQMEEVIEQLLLGLKDKDTVVRWSAAKGIGRVTGRLPRELADEVVGSIMDLFTISETDAAWHGGCLSLAELGRRGLLLPQRLSDVVPVIIKALKFDEKRGHSSVGSHVRDAACYVCWAFARAYDPQEVQPHVQQISSALVIVSVFDREINVRRAAAAAFQENVGRQGQFPHGIDILTTCDYFAVGNRLHCYHELSTYVAGFAEYTEALIDHLATIKVSHWDDSMRELCAEALHNLTPQAVDYMTKVTLPDLIRKSLSMDLSLRHGAVLAVAEITHALTTLAKEQNRPLQAVMDAHTIQGLRDITVKLHDAKLFRGVGGELMRRAACSLIQKLSLSKMPYHDDSIIGMWQELLDDSLEHLEEEVQMAAISAIPAFCSEYYTQPDGSAKPQLQAALLEKYIGKLQSKTENTRQGYALALGALPRFMLVGQLQPVLTGLIQASKITEKEQKWAEARRDAVKALTSVCVTAGVEQGGGAMQQAFQALFAALEDYTLDSRGDVGAWVREASMSGLETLTLMLVTQDPTSLTPPLVEKLFCHLAQQASEKIDRTRAVATETFIKLLFHSPPVPHIPHCEELKEIFSMRNPEWMNWSAAATTFPLFTRLLDLPSYKYHVLLGLTVSVGGLTESTVKHSAASLLDHLAENTTSDEAKEDFANNLLQLFRDFNHVSRLAVPLFKLTDKLLSNGCFSSFSAQQGHPFGKELLMLSKKVINKSGDPQKLLASIEVFCGLLQFESQICKKTLSHLVIFLCHRFPIVRKTTASKLYESLVMYDDVVDDEHLEQVMTLLSETQWDKPVQEVRPIRNQLCDLLGVSKPVTLSAAGKQDPTQVKQASS